MAQVGIIVLIIVAAAVLVGLFYISVKMLRDVSKQEKMSKKQPERQLHPKLQQDLKDKSNQQKKLNFNVQLLSSLWQYVLHQIQNDLASYTHLKQYTHGISVCVRYSSIDHVK